MMSDMSPKIMLKVILVNDESSDNKVPTAESAGAEVIEQGTNRGKGGAV